MPGPAMAGGRGIDLPLPAPRVPPAASARKAAATVAFLALACLPATLPGTARAGDLDWSGTLSTGIRSGLEGGGETRWTGRASATVTTPDGSYAQLGLGESRVGETRYAEVSAVLGHGWLIGDSLLLDLSLAGFGYLGPGGGRFDYAEAGAILVRPVGSVDLVLAGFASPDFLGTLGPSLYLAPTVIVPLDMVEGLSLQLGGGWFRLWDDDTSTLNGLIGIGYDRGPWSFSADLTTSDRRFGFGTLSLRAAYSF